MKYKPPVDDNGKPYYVPIVSKNKDTLVGYLHALETSKCLMSDVLKSIGIEIDLEPMEAILDSTRFNDILINGKRESEMSLDELKEYMYSIVEEVTKKLDNDNPENNILSDNILDVECDCVVGYYAWTDYDIIPDENFVCTNCGKVLIHYTGEYDHEYEYEGE